MPSTFMKKAQTVLAFDYGTRHIGVAVGQSITCTAQPLKSLKANDGIPNWDDIEKLIKEWQPDLLVVGLPLNMDGSPSAMTTRTEKFSRRLHGRWGLEVINMDERLSSFEAKGEIIEHSGSRDFKKQNVDSISAKLILESWFNQ